jgi:hypothetical protein
VTSKWLGALAEEKNKHNIVAALHVRGEPRAVGPDEKPKTSENLAAKTAKTAEAGRLGLIVTRSAEFGYVRPA